MFEYTVYFPVTINGETWIDNVCVFRRGAYETLQSIRNGSDEKLVVRYIPKLVNKGRTIHAIWNGEKLVKEDKYILRSDRP